MDTIIFIDSEPMIDPFWQGHKITSFDMDTNPLVIFVAYVKITRAAKDVTDLFRIVNVFLEERFDLWTITGVKCI